MLSPQRTADKGQKVFHKYNLETTLYIKEAKVYTPEDTTELNDLSHSKKETSC
jgi:hypothetical protein